MSGGGPAGPPSGGADPPGGGGGDPPGGGGADPPGDDEPVGDPRDPRFDAPAVRRSRRRWLPRWAVLLTLGLVAAMTYNLLRFGAGLGQVLSALGFAALVCAPVVLGLVVLERRHR